VCALSGATKVVVTDYPDVDLIENLLYNIGRLGLTGQKITAVVITFKFCYFIFDFDFDFFACFLLGILFRVWHMHD
jgi:hypothetical protein